MKKTLFVLLAVIITIPAFCQEKTSITSPEKNVLKVNTLSLIAGTGSIFYERKISDLTSAQLGLAFLSYKISDTKLTGIILTPEFRIYAKKNAIDGFYIAPYLRYMNFTLKITSEDDKATFSSMGGGLLLGRQWITNSGFTMDLFFGGSYGSSSLKVSSGSESVFDLGLLKGFSPRIGFALGFAF